MPPQDEVDLVRFWPIFMMKGRAVEEAMNYFSYMQEVTNAYATELIWTLALVLGCTCLYIWRALGRQEAARKHSHMVNSRPVFSSVPAHNVSATPSAFMSAYKNRFAHRDIGRDEERMNAVGYDILHSCDLSAYPCRVLPRAVWKRHSTGAEHEHFLPPQSVSGSNRNPLLSGDMLTAGPWGSHSKLPGLGSVDFTHRGPRRKTHDPVPAQQSRRSETTEVKDPSAPNYQPRPFNRNAYQGQQPHRQQAQTFQQTQQPNHRDTHSSVKRQPKQGGGHTGDHSPEVSPHKKHPVPAPREDRVIAKQPAKVTEDPFLRNHGMKQTKQAAKPHAEKPPIKSSQGHGDQNDETEDSSSSSEDSSTDTSPEQRNKTKPSSPRAAKQTQHARSEHQAMENSENMKNRESGKHPRKQCAHKDVRADQKDKPDQVKAQSQDPGSSQVGKSQRREHTQDKAERRPSPDTAMSRYKTASSLLEKFAKSYFTDHRQEEHQKMPNLQAEVSKGGEPESLSPRSRKNVQQNQKTSGNRVSRKRSKTMQKTESPTNEPSDTPKAAEAKQKVQKESYDSAVLRAIKDEEESKTSENTSENVWSTRDSSLDAISSDSRSTSGKKKATGDSDCGQATIHEAGRRLAKLRKRLEDSIQLIQSQPGLDKELLEKARSSKIRRQRNDLEMLLAKDDVIELNALGGNKDSQHNKDCDLKTPAELTIGSKSIIKTDAGRKVDDQQVSLSESSQTSQEVCDGEPSSSTRKPQVALPDHARDIPGTADGTQENKVPGKFVDFLDEKNKSSQMASSRATTERTTQLHDDDKMFKETETTSLDSDNTVDGDKMASKASGILHKEIPLKYAECNTNKNDVNSLTDLPRKPQSSIEETKLDSIKFLSDSGKILDEGHLDAILERQSKRREDLRQRKRMHIDLILAGKGLSAESSTQDLLPASERSEQAKKISERENNASIKENCKDPQRLSPVVMDGSPCLVDSKARTGDHEGSKHRKDKTSLDSTNIRKERPSLIEIAEFTPYVSTRSLGHLKYEEPEVQLTRGDLIKNMTYTESGLSFLNGELQLGPERESFARRRVRWRRQVEKQRLGPECQKTPPPVPPKVTRLSEFLYSDAASHNLHKEAKTVDANPENYKIVDSNERRPSELSELEDKHKVSDLVKLKTPDSITSQPIPSPRQVRGSLTCTTREKNSMLAAGETGLVKGIPDNAEICVEKSLTPSKAASVFDPKAQLEKEKEKQEAERALRASNREGMPSPQFRANIRLFEQATDAPGEKPVDSKVKANVKMFEDASNSDKSPERKRNERKRRSPSSPRPRLEPVLPTEQ